MLEGPAIFALASGDGRGAISVLRLSGTGVQENIRALCGTVPAARVASLRTLRDEHGEVLDYALVLWLPAPKSYTGENSAELHLHGGRAVLAAVVDALVAAGLRPAEPGEFTRRAFLNGKLDLPRAEAVGDLVSAETAAQRQQALRQLAGRQSSLIAEWAGRLRRLLAWQEALIDFPDEAQDSKTEHSLAQGIDALAGEMMRAAAAGAYGQRVRDGLVFAVVGAPNVGKSSLMNALAERPVAIVAETPGTTRDALEAHLVMAGVPVTLVDTAGLRDTDDPVEAEGIRRARSAAAGADLVLEVIEAPEKDVSGAPDEGRPSGADDRPIRLLVTNKIDRGGAPVGVLGVSALTLAGMPALREVLAEHARRLTGQGTHPELTRARHVSAVREAVLCLQRGQAASYPELRGEDFRHALHELGRITGAVHPEEILDTIFREFCIGK